MATSAFLAVTCQTPSGILAVVPDSDVVRVAPTVSQPSVSLAVGAAIPHPRFIGEHVSRNTDHALAYGEAKIAKVNFEWDTTKFTYGSFKFITNSS